jgi:hypothetical protein
MYAALLDDPDFLAELDKLEPRRTADRDRVDYYHPTLEEWAREQGIILAPPDETVDDRPPSTRVGRGLIAMVTFVGTLTGAAMAAFVFHDQVVQILSR